MRKTVILAALAASVALVTAAQASDHGGRSDGRAIERSEHDGSYRRDHERRHDRERASRPHHERREVRESRRHGDRDDAR